MSTLQRRGAALLRCSLQGWVCKRGAGWGGWGLACGPRGQGQRAPASSAIVLSAFCFCAEADGRRQDQRLRCVTGPRGPGCARVAPCMHAGSLAQPNAAPPPRTTPRQAGARPLLWLCATASVPAVFTLPFSPLSFPPLLPREHLFPSPLFCSSVRWNLSILWFLLAGLALQVDSPSSVCSLRTSGRSPTSGWSSLRTPGWFLLQDSLPFALHLSSCWRRS